MSINDKIHSGQIYDPVDKEIFLVQNACLEKQYEYNHTRPSEAEKRFQNSIIKTIKLYKTMIY